MSGTSVGNWAGTDIPVLTPGYSFQKRERSFIRNKVVVVTGAAKPTDGAGKIIDGVNIGGAIAEELAFRGAKAIALVDRKAHAINAQIEVSGAALDRERVPCCAMEAFAGDVTDEAFRRYVFDEMGGRHGIVQICVPAAGISKNRLSVKIDKDTGKPTLYPVDEFRQVQEVNLIAPVYWVLEMTGRIAERRWKDGLRKEDGSVLLWEKEEGYRGAAVLLGSVIKDGNPGQLAYSASKAGENGAAKTLAMEAPFHGVHVRVLNPGYVATPMVTGLGEKILAPIRSRTATGDLIDPMSVAIVVCTIIETPELDIATGLSNGWSPTRV